MSDVRTLVANVFVLNDHIVSFAPMKNTILNATATLSVRIKVNYAEFFASGTLAFT